MARSRRVAWEKTLPPPADGFEEEDLKKRCCSLIWRREHLCRGKEELGHRYYPQSPIVPVCIIFDLKKVLANWEHMWPGEKLWSPPTRTISPTITASHASLGNRGESKHLFKDCVLCTWCLVFRGATKLICVFQLDKTGKERLEQCFEYYSTLNESPVLEA